MPLDISDDELAKIAAVVPICARWNTSQGCKSGAKCKLRHAGGGRLGDPDDDTPLTHVSRYTDRQGYTHIVTRPPLYDMLQQLFKAQGKPVTLIHGKEWIAPNKERMITYDFIKGNPHDVSALAHMQCFSICYHNWV